MASLLITDYRSRLDKKGVQDQQIGDSLRRVTDEQWKQYEIKELISHPIINDIYAYALEQGGGENSP